VPPVPGLDGTRIRRRLADARLYLCTPTRPDLAEFADAALAGGVDVVQLRDKGLDAKQEIAALEVLAEACARHGALLAVNDRADVALAVDADVLHLGQDDLPVPLARRVLGDDVVIGRSTHDVEQARAAARRHGALLAVNDRADVALAAGADVLHLGQDDLPVPWARRVVGDDVLIGRSTHDTEQAVAAATEAGADYFCTGPCWPTPTKEGRPAPGLDLVRTTAAAAHARPWFAIGGIDDARLDEVLAAGATRVVVVRAITEADDPEAAARRLRTRL